MDTWGILGFIFGMTGMTFGIIGIGASGQVKNLQKEVEEMKRNLKDAGVLKEQ